MAELLVTQIRSAIGGQRNQRQTLRTLGLKRIGDSAIISDRPEILGMVATVSHLVKVQPAPAASSPSATKASREKDGK
jgi:large subunit ribosomal protein L30